MNRATATIHRVVLVTGMSGAGKTTVLKGFEDLGFEALDNVPLYLLERVVEPNGPNGQGASHPKPLAIGVDIRTRDFNARSLINTLKTLRTQHDVQIRVLFVDCGDEELLARYNTTRHRHPLAQDRPVLDGVRMERALLAPLLDIADVRLDTSRRTPYDVKSFLAHNFDGDETAHNRAMAIFVTSFSFRRGLPRDADLVFDVRFLKNPHYDPALRSLTGLNEAVQRFIAQDGAFDEFMGNLTDLLTPMLARYAQEGKSYLTIAVGCTGGKHRSVFVAQRLADWLEKKNDLEKEDEPKNRLKKNEPENLNRPGARVRLAHRDLAASELLPPEGKNGQTK